MLLLYGLCVKVVTWSVVLRRALDYGNEANAPVLVLRMLRFEERVNELEEARRVASLRSGTRGMKARKELKALEVVVAEEERRCSMWGYIVKR